MSVESIEITLHKHNHFNTLSKSSSLCLLVLKPATPNISFNPEHSTESITYKL